MSSIKDIDNLDGAAVFLSLSYLAHDLREAVPEAERLPVETPDDARQALAALAEQLEAVPGSFQAGQIVADDADIETIGRETLSMFLDDPAVRDEVEDLLDDPPEDAQMSGLELVAESAIVLGALIAWLQTKIEISMVYSEGKPEFSVRLDKDKTDPKTISRIVDYLAGLIKK